MPASRFIGFRALAGPLFALGCWLLPGCATPLRIYTSPVLRAAQQRPRTIAILPLDLTVNIVTGPGTTQAAAPTTGEAAMLQQMLYSMLLQQGRRRPVVIRNVDQRQLPAGDASLASVLPLARQWGVEALLITQIYRTQTLRSALPSTVTVYNDAAATATATSTGAATYTSEEVMLDMALYDVNGLLLWKYNNRATPLMTYTTAGRLTERLMEEGLSTFPFRR